MNPKADRTLQKRSSYLASTLSIGLLVGCYFQTPAEAVESKKAAPAGMHAQMAAPLGPLVNPVDPYDPNAKAWPIHPPTPKQSSKFHSGNVREDYTLSNPEQGSASKSGYGAAGTATQGKYFPSRTANTTLKGGSFVNGKFVLQGGVEEKAPETPDEITAYLKKMKAIISEFDNSILGMMSGGMLNQDPSTMENAKASLLSFITRVRTTTPPAQLKAAHGALADSMGTLNGIIDQVQTNPMGALGSIMGFQSQWFASMERYHTGVKNCIAYYHLSPSLDPVEEATADQKNGIMQGMQGMEARKMGELQGAGSSGAGGAGAGMGGLGGLGGMLGGSSGGGGMGDLGALGGMLGGAGGGGGGSPDIGSLMKMMGGAGGGGGGGSPDIGSLMKMMGGAGGGGGMGGGAGSGGGASGFGSSFGSDFPSSGSGDSSSSPDLGF